MPQRTVVLTGPPTQAAGCSSALETEPPSVLQAEEPRLKEVR